MGSTVTVSIGRNVGTVPLSEARWNDFTAAIHNLIDVYCRTVYVDCAESTGSWDGILEDSRTWVAEVADWITPEVLPTVVERFGTVARAFGQDAVAVTVGTTILAGLAPASVA